MAGRWPSGVAPEMPEQRFVRPDDPRYMTELDIAEAKARSMTLRVATSIALMLIGGILVSLAAGVHFGWPVGVMVGGALIFCSGFFIGLSN